MKLPYAADASSWLGKTNRIANDMKTILTKEGSELYDPEAERLHGPPSNLEHYYNQAGTQDLYCSTEEREEFEICLRCRYRQRRFVRCHPFDLMAQWLTEHCGLPVPPSAPQEPPTMHASDFRSALHFTNLFSALKLPVKVQCGHACFTITKENQDAVALGVLMAAEWNDCEPEPPESQLSAVGKYSNTPHKTIEQILSDATTRTAAGEVVGDVVNDLVDGYCLGHGSANARAVQEAAERGAANYQIATPAQRQCPRCGSPCREGTRGRWDMEKQWLCTACTWSSIDK